MVKVDGKQVAWREGMTVAALLKELRDEYPYPVARIGGRLITRPDFDRTLVPDHSEVFFISLVAGG